MKISFQNPSKGPLITVSFDNGGIIDALSVIGASRVAKAAGDGLSTLRTAAQFAEAAPGAAGGGAGVAGTMGPLALIGMFFAAGDSPAPSHTPATPHPTLSPDQLRCLADPYNTSAECAAVRSALATIPTTNTQPQNPNSARASSIQTSGITPATLSSIHLSDATTEITDPEAWLKVAAAAYWQALLPNANANSYLQSTVLAFQTFSALLLMFPHFHWASLGVSDPRWIAAHHVYYLGNIGLFNCDKICFGLPQYVDGPSLLEILNNPRNYVGYETPIEILTHGSNSASLPGVVRHGGLIPLGEAASDDPSFVFSGELKWWLVEPNVNINDYAISTVASQVDNPNDNQGVHWHPKNGVHQADINYSERPPHGIEFMPYHLSGYSWEITQRWQQLHQKIRRGWEQLTAAEQDLVTSHFPMIYQATNHVPNNHVSVRSSIPSEVGYRGRLVLGQEIDTLFVPREKVHMVETYLLTHNVHGVAVRSLESLKAFRYLFARYFSEKQKYATTTSPDRQP